MKNKKKLWIVAIILITIGLLLILLGLSEAKNKAIYLDSTGIHILGKEMYEEKKQELEEITEINIDVKDIKILFEEADTYGIEIKYYEDSDKVNWKIEDGILKINQEEKSKFSILSFDFRFLMENQKPYIKIYLPKEATLNNVSMYIKDNSVKIGKLNAKELKIQNKCGNVELEDLKVDNVRIEMEDGAFYAKDIIANKISLKISSGKVELDEIHVEEMNLESKDGKIIGKQIEAITSKIESKDGSIELEGDFIENTEISSRSGRVDLKVRKEKSYYNLDLKAEDGTITLDKENLKEEKIYRTNQENGKMLKVIAKDGNMFLDFNK